MKILINIIVRFFSFTIELISEGYKTCKIKLNLKLISNDTREFQIILMNTDNKVFNQSPCFLYDNEIYSK